MNALVFKGTRSMELANVPAPEPGQGEVRLRTLMAGVCGSEMHSFLGHSTYRRPGTIFGHELVGVVDACGQGVSSDVAGLRFVVDPITTCGSCSACLSGRSNVCASRRLLGAEVPGGFADFVVAPARNLLEVSSEVPDQVAVMAEPLANAVHVLRLLPSLLGRHVAIIGCGPIGLACLAVALLGGPAGLAVVDPIAERRRLALPLAKNLGHGIGFTAREPDGDPTPEFDLVIDAVGAAATRRAAIRMALPGGTVVALGLHAQDSELPMNEAIRKELRILASFAYVRDDFVTAIRLLNQLHETFLPWITVKRLAEGERAMRELADMPERFVKVALQP